MSKDILKFNKSKDGKNDYVKIFHTFSSMKTFAPADGKISGVAVPYRQKTNDWRKVSFAPGAFKNLKKTSLFVNHDSWDVKSMVGITDYKDTPMALMFEALLNKKDSDVMEKIIPLIEMGALEGVSIGAKVLAKEIIYDDDEDIEEIVITEAEVRELSLVTFQAFDDAKITETLEQEKNMPKESIVTLSEEEQTDKPAEQTEEVVEESTETEEGSDNEETETENDTEETTEDSEETSEESNEESEESEESNDESSEDGEPEGTESESESDESGSTEASEEQSDETLELSQEDFRKVIAEKDAEIAELKQKEIDKDKENCVAKLIEAGIVHNAQKNRILKSFTSAEAITEFYKDVPASFSVKPAGENAHDVTTDEINKEQRAELASQTSLSEDDFEKYGPKTKE